MPVMINRLCSFLLCVMALSIRFRTSVRPVKSVLTDRGMHQCTLPRVLPECEAIFVITNTVRLLYAVSNITQGLKAYTNPLKPPPQLAFSPNHQQV